MFRCKSFDRKLAAVAKKEQGRAAAAGADPQEAASPAADSPAIDPRPVQPTRSEDATGTPSAPAAGAIARA